MSMGVRRRFLLACVVPFACVFGATLLRSNALFALDGMINHTAVDLANNNNNKMSRGQQQLVAVADNSNITAAAPKDTCIAVRRTKSSNGKHVLDQVEQWAIGEII
jgi:hypothetical protein